MRISDWSSDVCSSDLLAAAATLEAFRGNLTPHDPAATAARPAPGQPEASAHLLAILAGRALADTNEARRLQDPLSIRTVRPLHGSLLAALRFLAPAVMAELKIGSASRREKAGTDG